LANVGNWEQVCISLEANENRVALMHEPLSPDNKISRCVDHYWDNKEKKCFEDIVDALCNHLHRRVDGRELAKKTGVDHRTICAP